MKKDCSIEDAKKYLDRFFEDPSLSTMPTGYKAWDRLTGGLVRGGLTVIAGRPAMGRTALLMNIVNRLSKDKTGTIMIFSPELQESELVIRLLQIGTQTEAWNFLNGRLPAEQMADRCSRFFLERKSKIGMCVDTYLNLAEIEDVCAGTPDLQLVIVDSPEYIVEPVNDYVFGNTLRHKTPIFKVIRFLKSLAQQQNVPVVCTAFLHCSLEDRMDKHPQMQDLTRLDFPDHLADQLIFLYRDSYYSITQDKTAECMVAKTHFGKPGTFLLEWHPETGEFREM